MKPMMLQLSCEQVIHVRRKTYDIDSAGMRWLCAAMMKIRGLCSTAIVNSGFL